MVSVQDVVLLCYLTYDVVFKTNHRCLGVDKMSVRRF